MGRPNFSLIIFRMRALRIGILVILMSLSWEALADRPFIRDMTKLWNGSPVKRPGRIQGSRWAGTNTTALPLSSVTGRSEARIRNLTDQKLCIGTVARTSTAVPDCSAAFPAGVCASSAHVRLNTTGNSFYAIPFSDDYGPGILCGTHTAATGSGFVYIEQTAATEAMTGTIAAVCGNSVCEYSETLANCPADCTF